MTAPLPVVAVGAFLAGSVPFGFLVARWTRGWDVRRRGSGNIGATNVFREAGVLPGVATLLLDLGKGALAVAAARAVSGGDPLAPEVAALAVLAGHLFPPWLRFRGGKGVAAAAGAFGVLHPLPTAGATLLFALVVAATRRVSAGSIAAAAALPVAVALRSGAGRALPAATAALLILWSHRANMRRLSDGTEPRIGDGRAGGPGNGARTG